MKIVFVNIWFTDGMGYIENCLPRSLAKRGHDVHIVTSKGKVFFNDPLYKKTYEKFFGPPVEKEGKYKLGENLTLHRLNFVTIAKTFYFFGLGRTLREIRPDVVHMLDVISPFTIQFFYYGRRFKFNVYTANHYVLSVLAVHKEWEKAFSLLKFKWLLFKVIPGKLLSGYYKRCYAATVDAKYVAEKYMGVPPEKCYVTPLGVDTEVFKRIHDRAQIAERRTSIGFANSDFMVLYTGRFAPDKNPLILAKAIDHLQTKGFKHIKGLFVGSGEQKTEIQSCAACSIVDFVPYHELYKFYQIADIGVWPTQESTSMLDAAASGIPIIVNNTVHATERYMGNGLTYELGNVEDLAEQILKLYNDADLRSKLGAEGERKMKEEFSWDRIAKEREADYMQDLSK